MNPEIKDQIVPEEQKRHDNKNHPGQASHRRRIEETAEEWGLSYWFGIEVTQEEIDKARKKPRKKQ